MVFNWQNVKNFVRDNTEAKINSVEVKNLLVHACLHPKNQFSPISLYGIFP